MTEPSGWSSLFNVVNGTGNAAIRFSAFALDAVGNEDGTSVAVTLNQSRAACAQVYRISGWGGELGTDVAVAVDNTSAAGSAPNPPGVTAGWGSADNLFLACAGAADDDATFSAAPTNYTDLTSITSGAGTNLGCEIGSARRNLAAASDDPGTFTLSESEIWVAATIVVEPAADGSTVNTQTLTSNVSVADETTLFMLLTRLLEDAIEVTDGPSVSSKINQTLMDDTIALTDDALSFSVRNRLMESLAVLSDETASSALRFVILSDLLTLDDDATATFVSGAVPVSPRIVIGFDQPNIKIGFDLPPSIVIGGYAV